MSIVETNAALVGATPADGVMLDAFGGTRDVVAAEVRDPDGRVLIRVREPEERGAEGWSERNFRETVRHYVEGVLDLDYPGGAYELTFDPGGAGATKEPIIQTGVSRATVARKLGLTRDDLELLYTLSPERGPEGRAIADRLRARYGIPFEAALGAELATRGVLTAAEGAWLDDADTVLTRPACVVERAAERESASRAGGGQGVSRSSRLGGAHSAVVMTRWL